MRGKGRPDQSPTVCRPLLKSDIESSPGPSDVQQLARLLCTYHATASKSQVVRKQGEYSCCSTLGSISIPFAGPLPSQGVQMASVPQGPRTKASQRGGGYRYAHHMWRSQAIRNRSSRPPSAKANFVVPLSPQRGGLRLIDSDELRSRCSPSNDVSHRASFLIQPSTPSRVSAVASTRLPSRAVQTFQPRKLSVSHVVDSHGCFRGNHS